MVDGVPTLTKNLNGFAYAECKPHGAACIVKLTALAGSQVVLPQTHGEVENCLEEFVASVHRRILRVTQIKVKLIVQLPSTSVLPKNFLTVNERGTIVMNYSLSSCKQIEYAHSSKGDLYFKGAVKGCQLKSAFPIYLNLSDAILTALNRA